MIKDEHLLQDIEEMPPHPVREFKRLRLGETRRVYTFRKRLESRMNLFRNSFQRFPSNDAVEEVQHIRDIVRELVTASLDTFNQELVNLQTTRKINLENTGNGQNTDVDPNRDWSLSELDDILEEIEKTLTVDQESQLTIDVVVSSKRTCELFLRNFLAACDKSVHLLEEFTSWFEFSDYIIPDDWKDTYPQAIREYKSSKVTEIRDAIGVIEENLNSLNIRVRSLRF